MRVFVCAIAAAVWAASVPASGQPLHLTWSEALTRGREQSPAVVVAKARIEESRGRLVGARVRFRDNPQLSFSAGPRNGPGDVSTDLEIGFSQTFETGGQRKARIDGAEAAIAADTATAEDVQRQALEAVARAYLAHERGQERRALLAESQTTAEEIWRIAERRYAAGDIAAIDVNLARVTASRARAATIAADADLASSSGVLARLLNLPAATSIEVEHALETDRVGDLAGLLAAIKTRPDFVALTSALAEADAELRLGKAAQRPDLGFDVRAKKEGDDRIFLGGLTVTLPWSDRGQGLVATGSARATRLRLELENTRQAARAEVTALHAEYERRQAAAAAFADALPAVTDNQQLLQRSFEEGELSLRDLIVVRREVIDTRLEYLDRLFEAAETAVERDATAGVLR